MANNSSVPMIRNTSENTDNPKISVQLPNGANQQKKNSLNKKKQITYYLSKEDIQFLMQKTKFSEQEVR